MEEGKFCFSFIEIVLNTVYPSNWAQEVDGGTGLDFKKRDYM